MTAKEIKRNAKWTYNHVHARTRVAIGRGCSCKALGAALKQWLIELCSIHVRLNAPHQTLHGQPEQAFIQVNNLVTIYTIIFIGLMSLPSILLRLLEARLCVIVTALFVAGAVFCTRSFLECMVLMHPSPSDGRLCTVPYLNRLQPKYLSYLQSLL